MVFRFLALVITLCCCAALAEDLHHDAPIEPDLFEQPMDLRWNLLEEHLKDTGQSNTSVSYFDLDDIYDIQFNRGFPLLKNTEYLFQERKKWHAKIGRIAPRIQFLFAPETYPSQVIGLFGNVFGPLIPYKWFRLFEQKKFYEARRYAVLDTFLDQKLYSKILYLQIHELKMSYHIILNLIANTSLLKKHLYYDYKKTKILSVLKEIEVLDSFKEVLTRRKFEQRKILLEKLTQLGHVLSRLTLTGHVDIKKMTLELPKGQTFLDKEDYCVQTKKRSLLLKQHKYMIKAAKYHLRATRGSFFTGDDRGEDYRTFGIIFGLDSLAANKIAASEYKAMKINYFELVSILDQTTSSLVYQYNENLLDYSETVLKEKKGLKLIEQALRNALVVHNEDLREGIDIHLIEFLLDIKLKLNTMSHQMAILKAQLDRLLVSSDLQKILKRLPRRNELKRLKKWARVQKFHSHHLR